MMLRAGVQHYPLPSTWHGQQCVLKTGRAADYAILYSTPEKLTELDPTFRGMPVYCWVDEPIRVIVFYPVPDTAYEVEFVEE